MLLYFKALWQILGLLKRGTRDGPQNPLLLQKSPPDLLPTAQPMALNQVDTHISIYIQTTVLIVLWTNLSFLIRVHVGFRDFGGLTQSHGGGWRGWIFPKVYCKNIKRSVNSNIWVSFQTQYFGFYIFNMLFTRDTVRYHIVFVIMM